MKQLLRFSISGVLGIFIVIGLFLMMLQWLSYDKPAILSTKPDIKFVEHQELIEQKKSLNPTETQKQQREKPLLQQAPSLELTDKGMFESGQNGNELSNALGTELENVLASTQGFSEGGGHLETDYIYKYYEHSLNFPDKAKKAGITEGKLVTRAIFSKNHEFIRFEILEEEPVDYFREVLYQLKFIKNYNHIYHPQQNSFKRQTKDASDIHNDTYKFVFDLNSSQPVRFYRTISEPYNGKKE